MYSAWLANLTPEQKDAIKQHHSQWSKSAKSADSAQAAAEIDHELERVVLHRALGRDAETRYLPAGTQVLEFSVAVTSATATRKHDLDEVHAVRRTWWKARAVSDQRDASRSIRRSQSARVAGPGRRETIHAGSARRQGRDDRQARRRRPETGAAETRSNKAASPKF